MPEQTIVRLSSPSRSERQMVLRRAGVFTMKRRMLRCCLVLAVLLAIPVPTVAHPDLVLQIEDLTQRINAAPRDADLYLKRGDLRRRHGEYALSAADFGKARELDPNNRLLDWYEGRLALDAGDYEDADRLLSRYLEIYPEHAAAWRQRAKARVGQEAYLAAADDFSQAIAHSDHPGPGLYRSLVLSTVAAGADHAGAAEAAVEAALERFPNEVTILGLGTELALARSDTHRALLYTQRIPQHLLVLPQWRFRQAARACLEGKPDEAVEIFSTLLMDSEIDRNTRAGTWVLPVDIITKLVLKPLPDDCAAAVWETLRRQL